MYTDYDIALRLIEKQIPNLNKKDINTLINHLIAFERNQRGKSFENRKLFRLDNWIPSPKTIREVILSGIRVIDIKYCIDNFQKFALTKSWKKKENLDAKFIAHVNIMVSKSKITLFKSN